VRYTAATTNLSFEVLDPSGNLYYTNNIVIDEAIDLPIASGSKFGIQSFQSSASGYENFWGSTVAPSSAVNITNFVYNKLTGEAIVTWTSETLSTYDLIGGSDVGATNVLQAAIPGQSGSTSATNTQPVGNATWFYRVKRN
jgi:hypothetical protein